MDMQEMLRRAQQMQEKAAELQKGLAEVAAEGQAGGGLVRATLNGRGALVRLAVDPSLMKPEEREILEDLVVAAHADAKRTLEAKLSAEMERLAGTLGLPPAFKLG